MKKLLLTSLLVLGLSSTAFAEDVNGNPTADATANPTNFKVNTFILSSDYNFGKYNFTIDGKILTDSNGKKIEINQEMNVGLTYLRTLPMVNHMFSVGAKFMVSTYGKEYKRSEADAHSYEGININSTSSTSLGFEPSYSILAIGNANVFNFKQFSTNVSLGLGVALNTLSYKDSYTVSSSTSNLKYNTYTHNEYMHKKEANSSFAYTLGLNETYNINSAWGVGLDVNYTSLGKAEVDLTEEGDEGQTVIKAKSNNANFGVGLSVKYNF